jgi:hypothetical protein
MPIPRPEESYRLCVCMSLWSSATVTLYTYKEYGGQDKKEDVWEGHVAHSPDSILVELSRLEDNR